MKLTVLGFYGGYPANSVGTSSYILSSGEFHLLLDCGSGALLKLETHMDPLALDAVLLSHYHHDHTADLGVLQYYWQLHEARPNMAVLPIYGPTSDPLNFGSLTWPHASEGHGYSDAQPVNIGPFSVTFMLTHHPVPAYAMRITEKSSGKVLVFTADTAYFEGLVDFAKGADTLLTDTNFFNDKTGTKWHMTSGESGHLAMATGATQLILTHLPQTGDLNQLVAEAQAAAPACRVERAFADQVFDI
ncbi:MBL fold metallo-hydrolase [uncultured Secundilactobacillus sp.]|uniref:MBL fold metallo-hydrolase n=1 Tax=uncultured Secundilactobacillus sp. TaxID=2813935 RepID=UPI0025900E8B|nr:MBL fold metallo-hydrolase [uncultured Secundilactobacillus sp.]